MRFASRAATSGFLIAFSAAASIVALSTSAAAEPLMSPQLKLTPKSNYSWSKLNKPEPATFPQLRSKLDFKDKYATLYALQIALMRVGDGQTYVWARPKRKLRAFITPVRSFRNADGHVCREIKVSLSLGNFMKRINTTACRSNDKSWNITS